MRKAANIFERFSHQVTDFAGSTWAFIVALSIIVVWGITGPLFHYSDTWQLVINTGTTIVTFLMVFLIQRAQNKDARAVALKLNELVAAVEGASNRLIDVESLSEKELETLHRHYKTLVGMAKRDEKLTQSHSVEEAEARHRRKRRAQKPRLDKEGAAATASDASPSDEKHETKDKPKPPKT